MTPLIVDNEVKGEQTSSFKALKKGLYVAQIEKVEEREEQKYQSQEMEMKFVFTFKMIKEATGGAVVDIEGETFDPLQRKLWKSTTQKIRYSWKDKIELTALGKLIESAGMDPHSRNIDLSQLAGKILVLTVDVKLKADKVTQKNVVSDYSVFNGNIDEINQLIDQAERDANIAQEIYEDVPYEEAGKKKA